MTPDPEISRTGVLLRAGGGGIGDGFGALAEKGVSEEQDRAGGHGDFIVSRVGYS
jgi:hypothetical protein